mmetsp:Transcript_23229/g.71776  ORF Transcript_23229/g.71776 Transcript_23229/m.71776 type:complete len:227 (+) Transcript_23229:208-888(+)
MAVEQAPAGRLLRHADESRARARLRGEPRRVVRDHPYEQVPSKTARLRPHHLPDGGALRRHHGWHAAHAAAGRLRVQARRAADGHASRARFARVHRLLQFKPEAELLGLLPDVQARVHPRDFTLRVGPRRRARRFEDDRDARAARGRALRRGGPRPHRDAARHRIRGGRRRRDGLQPARDGVVAAAPRLRLEPAALPHRAAHCSGYDRVLPARRGRRGPRVARLDV